jgi:acyl-coenzyme A thioesterase PaaI-like protein
VPVTFDPDVVRFSLMRQSFMRALGAEVVSVEPGRVVLALPFREDLCQQNGFLHAGVVTSVADSACGYAALTLMPPDSDVRSARWP